MLRSAAAVMMCLLIVGCSDAGWMKAGATRADFERDSAECARDANALSGNPLYKPPMPPLTGNNPPGFEDRCLAEHGWARSGSPGS